MPWASGSYTRLNGSTGWVDDKNAAIFIVASRHDNHDNDLATGINTCLTRDNQAKPTASFLPNADNSIDIGSAAFRWRAIYPVTLLSGDGAVATPGWSFSSDLNTGIYRIGADDIGLATGGILRLEIDANGGVSIKTPTSGAPLSVTGLQGALHAQFLGPNTGVGWNIAFYDTTNAAYRAFVGLGTSTVGGAAVTDFAISPGASGSIIIGTANGAGIGTRFGPSGHVRTVDGSSATPAFSFELDTNTGIYRGGTDIFFFTAGGVDYLRIDNGSQFVRVVTGQLQVTDGSAGVPGITFSNDSDTGFYRDTANQIGIGLAGVTAGQIAQGTFTGTLTGCTVGVTGTITWQRVGNLVTLNFPTAFNGTSNATTFTMTGLPAIIQPATLAQWVRIAAVVQNNGVTLATVDAVFTNGSGTVQFANAAALSGWTNVGTKGFINPASVSYLVS